MATARMRIATRNWPMSVLKDEPRRRTVPMIATDSTRTIRIWISPKAAPLAVPPHSHREGQREKQGPTPCSSLTARSRTQGRGRGR